MLQYLVRRIGIGLLTLLLITFIIYGLIRSMPGSPLTQELARLDPSKVMSEEDFQRVQKLYGLDKPWYQAYGVWVANLVQGDLGRSFSRKRPVADLIFERMGPTLLLSITSLLLTYLLSIPMGLYATARSGSSDERVLSTILYMLYSFPSFVAALFLQLFFAVQLGWLPLFGMTGDNYEEMSAAGKAYDLFLHSVMPVTCYTYGSLAYYSRFIRANMQEVIRQDYIRTARAKGLGPVPVLLHHAFRNTLIPLVTLVGLTLPSLLSGSVIIEQIFTWPGMGRLFFESIRERDYPTIMGLTLMFSVLTLAGQLLADILYAVVDPRVRLESK
ncbi:Glutathione transport system permease protein GsiC [Maioricimonas rarisocia]|uniref:Glutathione transport system permease protein GsiC n=1 Tax=Maioricimonas rarisocia TaxID=2528026 RepID=A0A517Z2V4_9PLAN|nr:ABC transporter permease [Maioricimonas rarisocia]QDU36778.1 Glutathione transport system permease protein GsiC [Maioricimonas rarisocia]